MMLRIKKVKNLYPLFAAFYLALTGCCTTHPAESSAGSETMLLTYHARPGKEAELQATLAQAWQVYQAEHMVFLKPHVIVRSIEDENKTRFVEIFTWITAPESPPADVSAVWKQEQSLCEARDGHKGIEGGPVELVSGK
jgi:hypothetical protein